MCVYVFWLMNDKRIGRCFEIAANFFGLNLHPNIPIHTSTRTFNLPVLVPQTSRFLPLSFLPLKCSWISRPEFGLLEHIVTDKHECGACARRAIKDRNFDDAGSGWNVVGHVDGVALKLLGGFRKLCHKKCFYWEQLFWLMADLTWLKSHGDLCHSLSILKHNF